MLVNMSGGKKVENIINEIVEPVLLWTNPNPTSDFLAQVINVETGYNAFLVEFSRRASTTTTTAVVFVPFSDTCYYSSFRTDDRWTASATVWRRINSANDGAIDFGPSYSGTGTSVNNGNLIPTRIWGVKYTL